MRKLLRSMAKAKMARLGYSNINRRMSRDAYWRKVINAYPVNRITGKKMTADYSGPKKNRPGSYHSLFVY